MSDPRAPQRPAPQHGYAPGAYGYQDGQPPRRRKRRRVFLWIFLAVQALFVIWLIAGLASAAHNITPHTVADCQAHANYGMGSLAQCVSTSRAASETGTGIGAALVIVFWMVVDVILGVSYGVYRLATRDR